MSMQLAKDNFVVLQYESFCRIDWRTDLKQSSGVTLYPIVNPNSLVVLSRANQRIPSSAPHVNGFGVCETQIAVELFQLICAPAAWAKVMRVYFVRSRFSWVPVKYNACIV